MNTDPQIAIQVDFQRKRSYLSLGAGLYRDSRTGFFYERPIVRGRQTFRKLMARTERMARVELGKNRADQLLARRGLADDPYQPRLQISCVQKLCDYYLEAGCPKRKGGNRTTQTDREERTRVAWLLKWWARKLPGEVIPENVQRYHDWRVQRLERKKNGLLRGRGGDRQVDKEMVTLSNVFEWAVRNQAKTGVTKNPLREFRITFRNSKAVTHCRERMPENAEQLHAMANYLFTSPRGEVLAWLLLFQAMIGSRISELIRLRLDADPEHAGHIQKTKDGKIGKVLWLYRSLTSKGTYSHAEIHRDLRDCLEAFLNWHQKRWPNSPWYFPSPEDPAAPVTAPALTHALRRICPAMDIPLKTSHGLRSYFVNVLRSNGKSDGEIALRIGQTSGGKLITQVYGEGLATPITWRPESAAPAWTRWSSTPQLELQF